MNKRRIAFIITSYIHYSRNLLILKALRRRKDVELHIIIGGAAALSKYSSRAADVRSDLCGDGFRDSQIHEALFTLEGERLVGNTKTVGLGVIEFSSLFNYLRPDLVVVKGDRFEVLASVIAAAYMNIPIAHIEGGDLSGTIDESVRHAITKFAHIHFTTNDPARRRVIRMGENPRYVFNFGSPDIEVVERFRHSRIPVDLFATGSGAKINIDKPFLILMYHPVTTEVEKMPRYTNIILSAIHGLDMPAVWFWPNLDAGSEEVAHELRAFRDRTSNYKIRFMRHIPPVQFIALLQKSACLVGNSSAGIKECSYLGVPAVNIGSRQNNRLRAKNIIDVGHSRAAIQEAVKKQLAARRYEPSAIYSGEGTSEKIAEKLATAKLYVQKKFYD